ncbi:hypothetical protein CRG98_025806 [Punica granatum]|uniref:Retrotransposon gag domain-containing protein n=1 Tax=Punica granatum TaxID=22663 RepID=A0A2I0JD07_PUNGR|nr:hypothetical protein CRG98_025806 [Punica granatum]
MALYQKPYLAVQPTARLAMSPCPPPETLAQVPVSPMVSSGADNLAEATSITRASMSGSDVGHYSATAKIGKLEFPRFSGEGVREWLYRCEQFFEVDMTPDDVKVKLVAIHLEGKALQWHQAYVRSLGVEGKAVIWSEYVTAVVSRFGDSGYEDPMADLKNLRQVGFVQDYMTEFDALLNRVTITESDALSHFLGD